MLNSQPGLLILKGGERQRMAKSCGKDLRTVGSIIELGGCLRNGL